MAQTGYTPISIYYSSTATNVPTAGNLVAGELAINTNDGVLYYKDSSGVVQSIASKAGNSGSFTNLAYTGTLTGGTGVVNLGSGQFYKDASGNVGIGTSSPATKLHISGTSGVNSELRLASTTNGTTGSIKFYEGTTTAWELNTTGANGSFYIKDSYNNTERMRIDSAGNVGIGTSSPSTKLQVTSSAATNNAISMSGSTTAATYLQMTTSGGIFTAGLDSSTASVFGNAAYSGNLYMSGAYPMLFWTNGTERMRIDSSGNLLVGTTATVSSAKFIASGSVGDSVSRMINSNASPSGLLINYSGATPNGGNNPFLNGYDGDYSNLRYKMASNGGLYNYSANNSNLSDIREKKNIELAGNYLDKICNIPVKTFLYNDQTDTDLNLGVIAQDVEAVAPELVMESNWGSEEAPRVRLSIYQTDLQYALMKAIQEQQAIIESLTTRLTALEAK
jgi:hypothetical protein